VTDRIRTLLDDGATLPVGDQWIGPEDKPVDGRQVHRDGVRVDNARRILFPFDESFVGLAAEGTAELATAAIDAAVDVRPAVAKLSSGVRRSVLTAVAAVVRDHRRELIDLLVLETGKPLVDCTVEVDRTVLTWSLAAEEPARLHGETVPVDLLPGAEKLVGYFTRRPAGVVVGIAGFNYPLMLASHKIAPALAAGCPVIVKPAPATPLATLWLVHRIRDILAEHDAPRAAVQLVTGETEVGVALTTDPRVAVVSFTGSAAVGHAIARACAPRKALLELGSNAALVVCADADLDAATSAILRGGFYASGQACISVQRVIVEEPVHDELVRRILGRLDEVTIGDPRDPATRVSALINPAATERVEKIVAAAVSAGATMLAGGERQGPVLTPTVLTNVPADAEAWCEEIFAPVIAISTVSDTDSALRAVNDSRYGLHAAVFTRSLAIAYRAIDELEVGGVVINDVPGFRSDAMPYGGVKDSGIGREGPRWAVEEFTVTRMAVIRPS
jgi:acyl-CoA reductase-like NAD-dependent aldehyde dehydrogenase